MCIFKDYPEQKIEFFWKIFENNTLVSANVFPFSCAAWIAVLSKVGDVNALIDVKLSSPIDVESIPIGTFGGATDESSPIGVHASFSNAMFSNPYRYTQQLKPSPWSVPYANQPRFLIVRNVPSLGCGDDLAKLFTTYGEVEEYYILASIFSLLFFFSFF
nr:RNA-binding protein 48-like [Ipomoea batatas]